MHEQILLELAPYNETVANAGFYATCASLIGSVAVLLIFTCVPETRKNFFFNIGFYISLSDLIFGISTIYVQDPNEIDTQVCQILGMGREFGMLASIVWTNIISWCVFKTLNNSVSDEELFKDQWFYLGLGYVPALLLSILPLFVYPEIYGPNDIYCWLSSSEKHIFAITAIGYYIPFAISFLLCMIWYCRTLKLIKAFITFRISREFLKLMLYPIILFLCNIGAIVDYFYVGFVDSKGLLWLQFTYVIVRQSQGFLNALVYANNYGVRNAIKRRYKTMTGTPSFHVDSSASVIIEQFESFEATSNEYLIEKYFNMKKEYRYDNDND
jgi:7 transmembrane receptor (Secretin family).